MTTALLLTVLALTAGDDCAAIDNTTHTAAWSSGHVAYYRDDGDRLTWDRPVPVEVHAAADTLLIGARGPKVRVACGSHYEGD